MIDKTTGVLIPFDFAHLYAELGLTREEQQIIAILLGIHYEFGNLKHKAINYEQFLAKLGELVSLVQYNEGIINELIIRLAILIQVADVKGLVPVAGQPSPSFPQPINCKPTHQPTKFADTFTALGYVPEADCCCGITPIAVQTMHELLAYFWARQGRMEIALV